MKTTSSRLSYPTILAVCNSNEGAGDSDEMAFFENAQSIEDPDEAAERNQLAWK